MLQKPSSYMSALGYFTSATLVTYMLAYAASHLAPSPSLLVQLAYPVMQMALTYIASRAFYGDPFKIKSPSSHLESLKYTLALMLPGYLPPVIAIAVQGPRTQYLIGKPGFVKDWKPYLPAYGLILWGVNSLIVAYLYNAVTYELFRRKRSIGIAAVTGLVALNYNAPLLSNYWNLWDIIFFGTAFAYSYSVKRSPLALSLTYIISEAPLWWCILAPLGERVYASYFLGRLILSAISIPTALSSSHQEKTQRAT